MNEGLTLHLVGMDLQLLDVRIEAANGRFAASVEFHNLLNDELRRLAETLRNFPAALGDVRNYECIGRYGEILRIRASCFDRAGHALLWIHLGQSNEDFPKGSDAEGATLFIRTEAAMVDDFVKQLENIEHTLCATLRQIL